MSRGRFVWYDLVTTDVMAAVAFYCEVVGWTTEEYPGASGYPMWKPPAAAPIGGAGELPAAAKAMGAGPSWLGHLTTPDLGATLAAVKANGGKLLDGPTTMEGVGSFATCADPCGAVFSAFQPVPPTTPPAPPAARAEVGQVAWHELSCTDLEQDWAFYATVFGWKKIDSFDMGPMGEYRMFGPDAAAVGGMMRKPAESPMSAWTYYFRVADLDRSIELATGRGAKLMTGPMEVPGGDRIAVLTDPQGAVFALHVYAA